MSTITLGPSRRIPENYVGSRPPADLVHCFAQMPQHMELVEQDGGLRGIAMRRGTECLPHVHHRQADLLALGDPQPVEKLIQIRLAASVATEPDRSVSKQVAHHDAIGVPLADRDLVDADDLWRWRPQPSHLLLHVLHFKRLDRLPIQMGFPCYCGDARLPATPPHVKGKPFGEKRTVGQPVQLLLFHLAAAPAIHPAEFQQQVDSCVAAGEVADAMVLAVVPRLMSQPADAAACFLARRRRRTMRALGSPKMPTTTGSGRNPGKRYASQRRRKCRNLSIHESWPLPQIV